MGNDLLENNFDFELIYVLFTKDFYTVLKSSHLLTSVSTSSDVYIESFSKILNLPES